MTTAPICPIENRQNGLLPLQLFTFQETVEAHLRNIFGKLGVSSRTEAALWATRHGYGLEE